MGKVKKYLLVYWAAIWLVVAPGCTLLWFYHTYIENPDSGMYVFGASLWSVLFGILGVIVILVGLFIADTFSRYIGLDDK